MAHILLVQDEVARCEGIQRCLERNGHLVTVAIDGEAAVELSHRTTCDLVILDWMLPRRDGLSVCRELRSHHLLPIIMLTARDSERDRVSGLEAGADDYVVKPFSLPELSARVQAMLRRVSLDDISGSRNEDDTIVVRGPLVIDASAHTGALEGRRLGLTRRELELLTILARHPGWTYTRDSLLDEVWGSDYEGLDRAVDTQAVRLRRKLGAFGERIEAVWGIGYRLRSGPLQ
jgi:DNA-binding response OmpR family regulator